MDEAPFWRAKRLGELSNAEWESLCDGCGKCCVVRLRDDDTDRVFDTRIACKLLDQYACRCTRYEQRATLVPMCVALSPRNIGSLDWMPRTCAYRLIWQGRDLPAWHHLVSGSRETIHETGMSVRGQTVSENNVKPDDLEDYLVEWPGEGGDGQ